MLTESTARWLLVLHTALGVAAIGAATHLVVWLRRYRRGDYARHRSVRRFAALAFGLHLAALVVGNVVYPTYRVEVRAAYLESPSVIAKQLDDHAAELRRLARAEHAPVPQLAPASETMLRAGKAVRWFDVKEHWVALGLFASAGLLLILALWDPREGGTELVPIVFWLAVLVAATLWLAAVIGVTTAAWRAP